MIEELVYMGLASLLILIIPIFRRIYFSEIKKGIQNAERRKRYYFFDFLRGLAILAVIVIHIGDNFYVDKSGNQIFIIFVNNIARFAVPFFFISSGILLLGDKNLFSFYLKKTLRIFLPFFLITSIVGVYYQIDFLKILHGFIAGSASVPYYFMAILLQLYILYPFLKKYSRKKYFLHVTFLITIASLFLPQTWLLYGIPLFPKYLFLFAYGMSQSDRFLSDKFVLSLRERIFWISILLYYVASFVYFQAYLYNSRVFYAVALINIFFFYRDKLNKFFIYPLICYLGRNSLWIYLIHFFIIQAIYPFTKTWSSNFYLQYAYFSLLGIPLSVLASLLFKEVYNLLYNLIIPKELK